MTGGLEVVLGLDHKALAAGFFGAVVGLSFTPSPPSSTVRSAVVILSGVGAAGYLTPIVAWYFAVPDQLEYSLSFLVGLSSLHVIPAVDRLIDGISWQRIIDAFIRKRSDNE